MGADLTKASSSDINEDEIRLKELSPKSISKIRQSFIKHPSTSKMDRSKLISTLGIGYHEADILFKYFDLDGNGEIDDYELTCALAMLIFSSIELKTEFIFKLYDFDSNNYLTKDELMNLVITMTLYKKKPVIKSDIEEKSDEIMREADLDLDRKLSLREFQSYAYKNLEVIEFLKGYNSLITSAYTERKQIKREYSESDEVNDTETHLDDDETNNDNENNDETNRDEEDDDNGTNNEFEEDVVNYGDEAMDPDLKAELEKDNEANKRNEEIDKIKKGVEYGNGFVEEEEMAGDEFGAIKPWMTNVQNCVPSNYKKSKLDGALPDAKLELEFVHGYRCHETRNNLHYTKNGNFIYHTAAIGIV